MAASTVRNLLKTASTSLIFLIVAPPAWAAPLANLEYQEPQADPQLNVGALLFRLVVSLVVVLGLAVIVIKFLQKRAFVTQTGRWIRIIDQVGIGPNKALLLSEIAGRIYVLGVTDHGISKLLEIEDTSQVAAILEESLEAGVYPWKGGFLYKFWGKPFQQVFNAEKEGTFDAEKENKR